MGIDFQHEPLDSSLTELKTMCSSCGCKSAEGGKKLHPGLYRYKGKIGLRKGWTECQECDDLVKLNDINWYYLKDYGQATVCDSCVGKYNYKKDRLSKGHRHGELAMLQFMEQDRKKAETFEASGCVGCQMQKPVSKEERAAIQKQVDKFNEQLALDPDDDFERYILIDLDDETLIEDAFFSRQGAWKPLTEAFRKRWGKRSELMDKISLAQVGVKSDYSIYSFEKPFWFEFECDPQDTATAEDPEGYGLGFEFDMTKEEAIEKARQIHKETKGAITMYNTARKRSGGGATRIHPKFWATPEMMEEQKEYYKREDMEWPTGEWLDTAGKFNAETFEAKGYSPDKPYYATHHEEAPTTIMHPVHCGHYKMVMDGRGKWYLAGFYDTIEEMFTDIFGWHMDSQIDGMLEDLNSEEGQERKREYQAIKTIGDARKYAKKHFGFKLDFAPCFRKQADYDSKALNALPITVFPIFDEYGAESMSRCYHCGEYAVSERASNCLDCGRQPGDFSYQINYNAESHRDSKGRFAEKPVLTGSVIGGLALGLIYLMRGK